MLKTWWAKNHPTMLGSDFEEISYLLNLMVLQAYICDLNIYLCLPFRFNMSRLQKTLTNDEIKELLQCEKSDEVAWWDYICPTL